MPHTTRADVSSFGMAQRNCHKNDQNVVISPTFDTKMVKNSHFVNPKKEEFK